MTRSKKLIKKKRGKQSSAVRFEQVIDSKGKIIGYLVGGVRYTSYAEALRQFRMALEPRRHTRVKFREYGDEFPE